MGRIEHTNAGMDRWFCRRAPQPRSKRCLRMRGRARRDPRRLEVTPCSSESFSHHQPAVNRHATQRPGRRRTRGPTPDLATSL